MSKKIVLRNHLRQQTIELQNTNELLVGRDFFQVSWIFDRYNFGFHCNLLFLQIPDKRVSRKHVSLVVLDGQVKVKACHVNPIFYKFRGTEEYLILAKDSEVTLSDSDKFSLLPTEFEYEIKIIKDEPIEPRATIQNAPADESIEMQTDRSENENNRRASGDIDLDRTPSPEFFTALNVPASSEQNADQENVAASPNGRKRSTDAERPESPKRPKPSTAQNDSAPAGVSSSLGSSACNSSTAAQADINVIIKPDPDAADQNNAAGTNNSANSTAATGSANAIVKPDPDRPAAAVVVKVENTPSNIPNPPLRISCEYGIRCYRTGAGHRTDFAHPSDADYRRPYHPPAPATAPDCPFGASCYRRNPDHFIRLQHPPSSEFS